MEADMRRLAAVSLGVALFLAPVAAWADEPDPEKVARIIEEIKAHRAAKGGGTHRVSPGFDQHRRSTRPDREPRAPHETPRPAPIRGER